MSLLNRTAFQVGPHRLPSPATAGHGWATSCCHCLHCHQPHGCGQSQSAGMGGCDFGGGDVQQTYFTMVSLISLLLLFTRALVGSNNDDNRPFTYEPCIISGESGPEMIQSLPFHTCNPQLEISRIRYVCMYRKYS